MVIISQKRIKIILSCILISLFVFSMHIAKKENELDTNNKTSEVTATPVSGKTVILDAGHGLPDERNSLLTLKNNIDLLQKIKCFKHFIFLCLKGG